MVFVTTWFKSKVDNITIEDDIVAGLRVKDLGITNNKIADNAVDLRTIKKVILIKVL